MDSPWIFMNRPVRRWRPAGDHAQHQSSRTPRLPRLQPRSAGPNNLIEKGKALGGGKKKGSHLKLHLQLPRTVSGTAYFLDLQTCSDHRRHRLRPAHRLAHPRSCFPSLPRSRWAGAATRSRPARRAATAGQAAPTSSGSRPKASATCSPGERWEQLNGSEPFLVLCVASTHSHVLLHRLVCPVRILKLSN